MRLQLYAKTGARKFHLYKRLNFQRHFPAKHFSASLRAHAIKPFLLADIGEGIRECEIIQWFVEPEARVEEWDKLCEVQSDKASVEITSRFAGVIKKLHYEAGEMAKVGKPLLDIDIQGDARQEDLEALTEGSAGEESLAQVMDAPYAQRAPEADTLSSTRVDKSTPRGKNAALATPAVRHLTKELNVNILDVNGTGRDGRVLKDDVYQFAKQRNSGSSSTPTTFPQPPQSGHQIETATPLSITQAQMFKTMTKSLAIPHFLYADEISFSALSELRQRLNKTLAKSPASEVGKLSFLPFIIKAVSMMLDRYPALNSRVDVDSKTSKPVLIMRSHHNIGIAMDAPSGLIVPVIKNVGSLNVLSIAAEVNRLQALAASGKLTAQDLTGGTITVSNIGSIGGTYVSPVIVEKEVAILGVGRMRTIPAFNDEGEVVKKQVCNFSWSADHRVIDGAMMARAAEVVRGFVEDPDSMVMHLR